MAWIVRKNKKMVASFPAYDDARKYIEEKSGVHVAKALDGKWTLTVESLYSRGNPDGAIKRILKSLARLGNRG